MIDADDAAEEHYILTTGTHSHPPAQTPLHTWGFAREDSRWDSNIQLQTEADIEILFYLKLRCTAVCIPHEGHSWNWQPDELATASSCLPFLCSAEIIPCEVAQTPPSRKLYWAPLHITHKEMTFCVLNSLLLFTWIKFDLHITQSPHVV